MCTGCGQNRQSRRSIVNGIDIVNITPTAFKKALSEKRLSICRPCSYWRPLTWKCSLNGKDMRTFCKEQSNECPFPGNPKW